MVKETQEAISCNGGGGALGHPKVFIAFKNKKAVCSYCGKVFSEKNDTEKEIKKTSKTIKK